MALIRGLAMGRQKQFRVVAQSMFTSRRAQKIIQAEDAGAAFRIADAECWEAHYYPLTVEEVGDLDGA